MLVVVLKRAISRRLPGKGLVFHSDRGVQYACNDFRKELNKHEWFFSDLVVESLINFQRKVP